MEKIERVTAILAYFIDLEFLLKSHLFVTIANICVKTFGMKGRKEHLLLRAIAQIRDKYVIGV